MASQMALTPLMVLIALLALPHGHPKKLPSFLQKCSLKDPDLNKCVLEAGKAALPKIMHGAEGLHLPDLDPLTVPEVRIQTGSPPSTLDMSSQNIVVRGLSKANLVGVGVLQKNLYSCECTIPRLEILSEYTVDGKILVLPIKGSGSANFTFENAYMYYEQPYTFDKRNGRSYLNFTTSSAKFNCTNAYFRLDNLFNGDKQLGDTVNNFMNENWREIVDELGQPFVDAAAAVIRRFALGVIGNVPYDEIFNDVDTA